MKRLILTVLAIGILASATAQQELTLHKCLETGLEKNYDIRIVRNQQTIDDNNATRANAGMLPTIDLTAGYTGNLNNQRTTPRDAEPWSDGGVYDQTFSTGVGWSGCSLMDFVSAPTTSGSRSCRRWVPSRPASPSRTLQLTLRPNIITTYSRSYG